MKNDCSRYINVKFRSSLYTFSGAKGPEDLYAVLCTSNRLQTGRCSVRLACYIARAVAAYRSSGLFACLYRSNRTAEKQMISSGEEGL